MTLMPVNAERFDELLIDRATTGLSPEQQAEYEHLLQAGAVFDPSYELVAAAIDLASQAQPADQAFTLPRHLRERIAQSAADYFGRSTGAGDGASTPAQSTLRSEEILSVPAPDSGPARAPGSTLKSTPDRRLIRREWIGWAVAAASILVAAMAWFPQTVHQSPAKAMQRMIEGAPRDLVRIDWVTNEDPAAANAVGEVVWSDSLQTGFMKFSGLASNDPNRTQYQLWIFDESRDPALPVDGGVFDVPPGSRQVVVPIDAKLFVQKATLFAVTIERPGGVVQSKRERLPLLAKRAP